MGGGVAMRVDGKIASVVNDSFSSSDTQIDATASPTVTIPCFESDDSKLADEVVSGVGEPMPRLVLGGAPTLEEAKDATSELRAYLSNKSSGGPYVSDPEHDKLAVSKSGHLETKACVTSDTKASAPNNAIRAFRLLNESAAAQTVVASIASDQNVWTAIMQNEALTEFLQYSQKTGMNGSLKESTAGAGIPGYQSPKYIDDKMFDENKRKNGFKNFILDIIVKLEELMSSLSAFFQNLFGGPGAVYGNDEETFMDKSMGYSIMEFVVTVIMVIVVAVLKRL